MTGNSMDSGVCLSTFFSSRKVSQTFRSDCDGLAEARFPGEEIRPAPAQGYCSYTVFVGEDKVVQFRPPDHGLDVDIISTARRGFGDIVPETEFLGVVQDETDGAGLHAYSMRKLPGTSLVGARRSEKSNTKRARSMRRQIVKDFAQLQAASWDNRIRNNEVPQRGLIGASLTWRAKLLESALPDRFKKFASSNLQRMWDLEQLPWALTHGDLIPSNILVDSETGSIVGLLDWAEAEWLPFGVGLYGLEELLGEEVDGEFTYFPEARKLRHLFWSQLLSHVPELRANPQLLSTVKEAQILGVLLWHGIAFDDGRLDRVVEKGTDDAEISRLDATLLGRSGLRSAKTYRERLTLSFHELCWFLAGKW